MSKEWTRDLKDARHLARDIEDCLAAANDLMVNSQEHTALTMRLKESIYWLSEYIEYVEGVIDDQ